MHRCVMDLFKEKTLGFRGTRQGELFLDELTWFGWHTLQKRLAIAVWIGL